MVTTVWDVYRRDPLDRAEFLGTYEGTKDDVIRELHDEDYAVWDGDDLRQPPGVGTDYSADEVRMEPARGG